MIGLYLNILDTPAEKDKFNILYSEYKNLLYWIAMEITHCVEDAEECVQKTFLYVAQNFEKIGEVKSKRTKCYLSTIVTGFAIDFVNESKKLNTVSFENTENIEYFEKYDNVELLSVFDEVLNEESKVFLYLKYIFGYKSSEISEIYNVNDTYVRKKIQYAKQKLRKHLEE